VNAVSVSIHVIGVGLAQMSGLNAMHAFKQVDRLLSNVGVNVWALFADWELEATAGHVASERVSVICI
jgi:hypothetical protein